MWDRVNLKTYTYHTANIIQKRLFSTEYNYYKVSNCVTRVFCLSLDFTITL